MNKEIITGAAMLETMWKTGRKDILDLITPFVLLGISETTEVGGKINCALVCNFLNKNSGYINCPESVVEKILIRNKKKYFQRNKKEYFLAKSLDKEIVNLNKRRIECIERLEKIGESLSDFLSTHCKQKCKYDKDEAILCLQDFFSRHAIDVDTNKLKQLEISVDIYETDYYVARYILEQEKLDNVVYDYIKELVNGYFLQTAIYLQAENFNIVDGGYKDTVFYYDTPFLINLLGFQSEKEESVAISLHKLLQAQGASFAYFQQTAEEIESILKAYKYSLIGKNDSGRTLRGLDEKKYAVSDVERLIDKYSDRLKSEFHIRELSLPSYITREDGMVDEELCLDENAICEYIKSQMHYKDDNLKADVASVLAIYRLRGQKTVSSIENAKALFVTTNKDFVRVFNQYFKENMDRVSLPLVIRDWDLSAIAWIKSGDVSNKISQKQLLVNAYMVIQPSNEFIEKFRLTLVQLENEGKITREEVLALRTSRYVKREIMNETYGDVERITLQCAETIGKQYREHVEEQTIKEQVDKAERKAYSIAKKEKNAYIDRAMKRVRVLCGIVIIICIFMNLQNWKQENINVAWIVMTIVGILSVFDTVNGRLSWSRKIIEKGANQYETKIYEEEKRKYMEVINRG